MERSVCDWLSLSQMWHVSAYSIVRHSPFSPSLFLPLSSVLMSLPLSSLRFSPVLCVSHSLFLLFHMVSRPFLCRPTIACTLMCALTLPRRPQQTRNPCEALVFLSSPSTSSSRTCHLRDAWGIIVFFPNLAQMSTKTQRILNLVVLLSYSFNNHDCAIIMFWKRSYSVPKTQREKGDFDNK